MATYSTCLLLLCAFGSTRFAGIRYNPLPYCWSSAFAVFSDVEAALNSTATDLKNDEKDI